MTHPLLFIVFFNLINLLKLNAQTATIHLLLLDNDNGKPLQTNIKWHSLKTSKDLVFKTDKDGKATFVVEGNQKYETSLPNSQDEYDVDVPNTPNSSRDLTLKFSIDKQNTQNVTPSVSTVQQTPDEIIYRNLIGLQILNKPSGKVVEVIDIDSQKVVFSSSNDTSRILLPIKRRYKCAIKGINIQNDVFSLPTFSTKMMPYILYFNGDNSANLYPISEENTAINLTYINLKNKPVNAENIVLIGQKTGIKYTGITGENGATLFLVPKNDIYEIHLKYFPKISTINVQNSLKRALTTFNFIINYPSSEEVEKQKIEQDKRIAERDSLYKLFEKAKELKSKEFTESVGVYKEEVKEKLKEDDHTFEKKQNAIGSVLYRFRKEWTQKVIVTDVTGSMFPYMKELATWQALGLMKEEKNTYLFFNDGDDTPDRAKIIGKTGGIYTTQSAITDTIIQLMYEAMDNGNGGDFPENNIEALIEAQKYAESPAELIMVADNFSAIKDMVLLPKLTKPVHIILCGVNKYSGIHPDYLWLAYKTKGSIHTIEEDIMDIGKTVEGKTITIKGRVYQLLNNRFFEIK
jgi:hypothetical protein